MQKGEGPREKREREGKEKKHVGKKRGVRQLERREIDSKNIERESGRTGKREQDKIQRKKET